MSITAIYHPLQNPSKWFDMDIIAVSKTMGTCKVLVPSIRSNVSSNLGLVTFAKKSPCWPVSLAPWLGYPARRPWSLILDGK
jgi:hypothetical protein